ARTYADLIKTRPVVEQVASRLNITTSPDDLARLIDVRLVRDTQLLQINVEYSDPAAAANIANALAQIFIHANETVQSSRFEASRESLGRQLDQLAAQIDQRS